MDKAKLFEARVEAVRFTKLATLAIDKINKDNMINIVGSKETATVKRASMDLTRALAEMRK